MLETFNNRELAMATLVALFFIWVLRKASVREAMHDVLSVFFQKAILFHLSLFSFFSFMSGLCAENQECSNDWSTMISSLNTTSVMKSNKASV